MGKILLAIWLAAFLLLRPGDMQARGMMYPGDDYDYFSHASSLAFGQFPSYTKEYLDSSRKGPFGAIGCGILAAPFVYIFSRIDRWEGSDIVHQRTSRNLPTSWAVYGFVLSSVFYFTLACLLLYEAVRLYIRPQIAAAAVILMVICQGMPLFVYRRPVFSHTAEFFLQSLMVYLFLKNEWGGGTMMRKWWASVLVGAVAAMIFLTRYNNFLFALSWPLLFIGCGASQKDIVKHIGLVAATFLAAVSVFKFWPQNYNHYVPYANPLMYVLHHQTVGDIFRQIVHIFIGMDWGLIYTAPFLLLGIGGVFLLEGAFRKRFILACLPILVNFFIIVFFGSQGGWYGYRYLIASAFPLFVLPLAVVMDRADRRIGFWSTVGWGLLALLPLASMLCFESNDPTNLAPITQSFGFVDWGNATYQLGVWQTLAQFKDHWIDVFQGGFQYFQSLYSDFDLWAKLHKMGDTSYPLAFDSKTFIRVMVIYLLPFFLGGAFLSLKSNFKPRGDERP